MIQHKLDLHAAGFVYNPVAGVDLPERRRTFHEYLSSLDFLSSVRKRIVDGPEFQGQTAYSKTAGGVYAIITEARVHLIALGSALRGIPYREWEIPVPSAFVEKYDFYPNADIVAFVVCQSSVCVIYHRNSCCELIPR